MKVTKIIAIENEKYLIKISDKETIEISNIKKLTQYFTTLDHICELLKMEDLNKTK